MNEILAALIIACANMSNNAPAQAFNSTYMILKNECIQAVSQCVHDERRSKKYGFFGPQADDVAVACAKEVNMDHYPKVN